MARDPNEADWMNSASLPVLRALADYEMPLSPRLLRVVLDRTLVDSPSRTTVYRALEDLERYGLVIRAAESANLYELPSLGHQYLAGEVSPADLSEHPYDVFAGSKENGDRHITKNGSPVDADEDFDWGQKSQPAIHLAEWLLKDVYDDRFARAHRVLFRDEAVANFPTEWELTAESVRHFFRSRDLVPDPDSDGASGE